MKAAPAKIVVEKSAKRPIQQTPLNLHEKQRLEDLILRFQDIVVARNKRLSERTRAGVSEVDVIRAGLMALEKLSDEEFRVLLVKAKNRE